MGFWANLVWQQLWPRKNTLRITQLKGNEENSALQGFCENGQEGLQTPGLGFIYREQTVNDIWIALRSSLVVMHYTHLFFMLIVFSQKWGILCRIQFILFWK